MNEVDPQPQPSLSRRALTWLRGTFSLSTSRESWEERFGFLVLLAGAGLSWYFADRMSVWQQSILWTLLVVAAAFFLRRGWLTLFGPVLFYDMIRAGRRGRYFLLRMLYAGLLLFILFCIWFPYAIDRGHLHNEHRQAANMALTFFEVFMLVQLIAVTVLTPAYVAGAISEEKDRKTLEFLLATDLRNREIVLSKLGARLANLSLFVLTGLPILAFLQLIGGVDPTLVLTGFAATGLTMLGLGSVSILNSVYFKRPRDAIAITYLMLLTYVVLGSIGYAIQKVGGFGFFNPPLWFGADPYRLSDLVTHLNSGNLVVAASEVGLTGSSIAPALLGEYAIFHGILSGICITWAIVRLRRIALKQAFGRTLKAGARHRGRAPVGIMPMLWKEVSVEGGLRLNWIASIILAILFLLTLAPAGIAIGIHIYDYFEFGRTNWDRWDVQGLNIWVRLSGAFVGALLLLAVAVRASTAIGTERDKQTLDCLLTTPLDSNAILWGKFLGSVLSVRLGWIWLGIIWTTGLLTGALHVFALPLLLVAWFVFASFLAMLGLWFSMTARTTMRATVYTVLGTIFVWGGHWLIWMCCIPLFALRLGRSTERMLEYIAKFQAGLTGPAALFMFSFSEVNFMRQWGDREIVELIWFSLLGVVIWAVVCVIFWFGLLAPRFRQFTLRQEETYPEVDYYPGDEDRRSRRPPPLPE